MNGNFQELSNGLIVSIDWLSFTIMDSLCVDDVLSLLGYDRSDFDLMAHGACGYKSMLRLNGYPVSVLFDGNEGMGVHVDISGSAMSEIIRSFRETKCIETPFGSDGYEISDFDSTFMKEFLMAVKKVGHMSRIDLAVDDLGANYFTTGELFSLWNSGCIVSRFRGCRNQDERASGGEQIGNTVYFGSRKSDVFLRVYDKQLEQNKKRSDTDFAIITPWVRWELECKNERADSIADALICGMSLGDVVVGVLGNYIRIVENDNANKSRCTIMEKWASFIDAIKPLRLYVPFVEKNMDDKKAWINKQVMPTLAAIIISDGGSLEFLDKHLPDGALRMKKELRNLVNKELMKCEVPL